MCLNDSQQDSCLCCIKCVKQLAYGRARGCAGGVGVTWFAAASHPGAFESPGPSLHQSRGASAGLPSGTPNFHQSAFPNLSSLRIFYSHCSRFSCVVRNTVLWVDEFFNQSNGVSTTLSKTHVFTVSLQALVSFY